MRSLRCRAEASATPLVLSAPLLGVPSVKRRATNVVSVASCAPPWRDRPSATTSCLLSKAAVGRRSVSRKPWRRHSPVEKPFAQEPLPQHTRTDGGHKDRVDDIGTSVRTRGGKGGPPRTASCRAQPTWRQAPFPSSVQSLQQLRCESGVAPGGHHCQMTSGAARPESDPVSCRVRLADLQPGDARLVEPSESKARFLIL